MGKLKSQDALDAALGIIGTCNKLIFLSGAPTNYAGCAALTLADKVITPAAGGVVDAGAMTFTTSGSNRVLTIAAQTNLTNVVNGTITHVAAVNTTTSKMHLLGLITPNLPVVAGGTYNRAAIVYTEVAIPT
jgi:hypothetical protein